MRSSQSVKAGQQELFPKRPYEEPGKSAEYSAVPEELPSDDRKWMESLEKRLWEACAPDRFGLTFHVDRGSISKEEMERIFSAVRRCKLLTTMGEGTFGLSGYSMTVWIHPPTPGLPPEPLATITDKHLPVPNKEAFPGFEDVGPRSARDEQAWLLFSQFTHSPVNRQMLSLYKDVKEFRIEAPRSRTSYDY